MNYRKKLCLIFFAFFYLTSFSQQVPDVKLKIVHLVDNFYVYITQQPIGGNPFPANGMYVVTRDGVVVMDTPWDSTQFQPFLDSIEARHHKKVILFLATHFHADRTGGFDYYRSKGIKTYATKRTDELCKKKNEHRPEYIILRDTTFSIGGITFRTFFPGEGHTTDNIVVWFDQEKILYGGCLIKSTEAEDIGFTGDANMKAYPKTIINLKNTFRQPVYIIPGHQGWADKNSLNHTLELIKKYQVSHPG